MQRIEIFKVIIFKKSIVTKNIKHDYLNASTTTIDSNRRYTITDLNFVSIQTGKIYE